MATPKDLPQDIGGFIRDLRQTAKISLRQLAERAGVSNPYLSQIERGLRKPSAEVLQQLASALRVSTPAMYLRAGLLDSEGQQGVLAAIAADPELTMAQKQSLTQIYETFRNENARHAPSDATPAEENAGDDPADDPAEDAGAGVDDAAVGAAEDAVPARQAADDHLVAVIEDVAVVEDGAAPPPKTRKTTEEKK
jgi:transcriptional regulator with XRE-family HTH domain